MVHLWSKERPIKAEITWKFAKSLVAQLVTSSWCVYDIHDSNSSSILLDYQKKKKKKILKSFCNFFSLFLSPSLFLDTEYKVLTILDIQI